MATEEHELLIAVNVSVDGRQEMAGFEVSINGRLWVSTEVLDRKRANAFAELVGGDPAESVRTGVRIGQRRS